MHTKDKDISETLMIPRLTLHSWKNSNGYTKLLYAIFKNMSVSELKRVKEQAVSHFNLLIINEYELYNRLLAYVTNGLTEGYAAPELICDGTTTHEMILVRILERAQADEKYIHAHYIVRASHNASSAKSFIKKILNDICTRESVENINISLNLYGEGLRAGMYQDNDNQGYEIILHDIKEDLGITQELIMIGYESPFQNS